MKMPTKAEAGEHHTRASYKGGGGSLRAGTSVYGGSGSGLTSWRCCFLTQAEQIPNNINNTVSTRVQHNTKEQVFPELGKQELPMPWVVCQRPNRPLHFTTTCTICTTACRQTMWDHLHGWWAALLVVSPTPASYAHKRIVSLHHFDGSDQAQRCSSWHILHEQGVGKSLGGGGRGHCAGASRAPLTSAVPGNRQVFSGCIYVAVDSAVM